jgi:hypothetical protein
MHPISRFLVLCASTSLVVATGLAAEPAGADKPAVKRAAAPVLPAMAAQKVVDAYLAARGGAAWKSVNTLLYKGRMGAGATTYEAVTTKLTLERKEREEFQLPFVLEAKRPNKERLELTFNGQTAIQVFDGKAGYKYRPYLNRSNWEPYAAAELKAAQAEPGVEGWLASAAENGARVESDGAETVGDHDCYRLKVTRKDGQSRRVWIDSKTYLEVQEDGDPRMLDGRSHAVVVAMADYRRVNGLMVPFLVETSVKGAAKPEKMIFDSVSVNPPLDDGRFMRPR